MVHYTNAEKSIGNVKIIFVLEAVASIAKISKMVLVSFKIYKPLGNKVGKQVGGLYMHAPAKHTAKQMGELSIIESSSAQPVLASFLASWQCCSPIPMDRVKRSYFSR